MIFIIDCYLQCVRKHDEFKSIIFIFQISKSVRDLKGILCLQVQDITTSLDCWDPGRCKASVSNRPQVQSFPQSDTQQQFLYGQSQRANFQSGHVRYNAAHQMAPYRPNFPNHCPRSIAAADAEKSTEPNAKTGFDHKNL